MKYTVMELSGNYRETGMLVSGLASASNERQFRMDHLRERIDQILRARSIKTVIFHRKEDFSCPSVAGTEAIRRLIIRLRADDRSVIYYAVNYGLQDLYLASSCNRRVIHPLGTVSFLGRAVSQVYLGKLLNKQSIAIDLIRHGRYKSGLNRFTQDNIDRFDREQLEHILHVVVTRIRTLTSSDMLISDATMETLLNGRVFTAQEALEREWVERLDDFSGVEEEFRTQRRTRAAHRKRLKGRIGRSGPRVSLLYFEGAINHGENRRSPLFGQVMGSDWYVRKLREIRENRKIQALVLRVNSPGGSASASEDIRRELARIREKKPVIVSMGPVAASGGYWISTAADRIFAQKFTITGSIGVLSALVTLNDFLKKQGVTASVVKQGDHADLGSVLRKMSMEERRIFEQNAQRIYNEFISLVATARGLSEQDVLNIAEGRIWTGEDAIQNGLVDEAGDLNDALTYAADAIGVSSVEAHFGPHIKRGFISRLLNESRQYPGRAAAYEARLPGSSAEGSPGLNDDLHMLHARPLLLSHTALWLHRPLLKTAYPLLSDTR